MTALVPKNAFYTRLILAMTCAAGLCQFGFAQSGQERLAQLDAWLPRLNAEAGRLEDLLQIQRLQRAYGYYVDKGYWHEAADLFAGDATMEVGVDGLYRGHDRIRELITRYGEGSLDSGPGLPFGKMNRHMQLQPVVTLDPDGMHARARWRDFSMLGQYRASAYWGDAVMENEYIKEDGIWKILHFRLYPNFVAPYEGGWAALPLSAGDWRSPLVADFPPDAPPTRRYQPFPALYTPPFHYAAAKPLASAVSGIFEDIRPGSGEIGRMERQLLAMARELENLEIEREIENLQAKYGYYIDKGMWTEAAALFSRDATYEFGQRGVYRGRDRIHQALGLMGPEGLEPGMLNNYPMLQPIISVSEDNRTARGRWRSDVQLSRAGQGYWGGGVYENEYVLEDGEWKISKLHYYVTFWAAYDKGWQEGTLPMDGPSPRLPPDSPPTEVYGSQPAVYFFPFHFNHPVTGNPHPNPHNGEQVYRR